MHHKTSFELGVWDQAVHASEYHNGFLPGTKVQKHISFYISHREEYKTVTEDNWKSMIVNEVPMIAPYKFMNVNALIKTVSADS